MNELPLKERMKIDRHPMPAQLPEERIENFDEVNLGYSLQIAQKEAQRCLQCKDAPCTKGCPVNVHIPEFLSCIIEGDLLAAADVILNDNFLPAICGRVCPQETLCESVCVLAKKGKPVAIGNLERFTADSTTDLRLEREMESIAGPTRKKVALVGSGPSSLACAGDLARYGHSVTVFEALHAFGGVLVFGIPEFRLPKSIVNYEIDVLRRLGVRFEKNIVIGKTMLLDELMNEEGYNAAFIGAGAGLPYFLGIPGEELVGIYSANELLTRINLMKAYKKECFGDLDLFREMHRFIPAMLEMQGYKVGEVKVSHHPRIKGVSKYNWKRAIKGLVDMIAVWFWRKYANRPLHLFGAAGIMFSFLGTAILIWMAVVRIFYNQPLQGKIWPVIGIFLFLIGIQLFVSGLLADIAVKNYYKARNSTNYSIKRIIER